MKGWYRFKEDISVVPEREGVYLLAESASEYGVVYAGRSDNRPVA